MEEKIIIQEKGAKNRTKKYILSVLCCLLVPVIITVIEEIVIIKALWPVYYVLLAGAVVFGIYNILCFFMSKCEIAVTTHRVYGRSLKEQVDLPLDSISAVKKGWFRSVVVATSSGKVVFYLLTSQDKIFSAVSDLLKDRQNKKQAPITSQMIGSNADEVRKYKELLDSGIITQEEFDAKKKQLLGL